MILDLRGGYWLLHGGCCSLSRALHGWLHHRPRIRQCSELSGMAQLCGCLGGAGGLVCLWVVHVLLLAEFLHVGWPAVEVWYDF